MNKVVLIGRLTKDPEVRDTESIKIARYIMAVDRKGKEADFIPCVVFGNGAGFAEKYLHKGMKIAVTGRIQSGSYTNKDGQKVYTIEVVVNDQEFVERKTQEDGFLGIPEGDEPPFR